MINLFIIFAIVDPPILNEVFILAKERRMSNVLSSSFMVFYSTRKKCTKEIIGTAKHLCCKQDMRSCECKFRLHNQTKKSQKHYDLYSNVVHFLGLHLKKDDVFSTPISHCMY